MTSEHPYPASTSGPDPQDAPSRARTPFAPGTDLTPFSAFGGDAGEAYGRNPADAYSDNSADAYGGNPADAAPASAPPARAAVRMPAGLVSSGPPVNPSTVEPSAGGRVYGRTSTSGAVYGAPAAPEASAPPPRSASPLSPEPTTYGTGAPAPRIYGQPYAGSPVDADPEAPAPVQAPARPAVPIQRTSTVYGQRQPAPAPIPAPAEAWPEPSGFQTPPGFQPPQQRAHPQTAPPAAPVSPARPQFEQHGRQSQAPRTDFGPDREFADPAADFDGGAPPAPRQRATWQEQLQPMVSTDESRAQAPISSPTPYATAIPAEPKSKLRIIGYIAIAVLVIGLGAGALYYTSRTSPPAVGSCVKKQANSTAINVTCSTPGAYKVVKSATKASDCPDYLNEPSLSYESGGKTTILCLQPESK